MANISTTSASMPARKAMRYSRLTPDEFVDNAKTLVQLGWHPIPLGKEKGKTLLVTGVSGHNGVDVDDESIFREWADNWSSKGLNLGVRMPVGVVGLDVDCYEDKPGATTLVEFEARWGVLPSTWSVTARTDGSRKMFFRVPVGWTSRGVLGPGVEVIQRHHRYSVAPPSVHGSGRVRALAPDGHDCGQLPPPSELPDLPVLWLKGLAHDAASPEKGSVLQAGKVEASFRDGPMSATVHRHVDAVLLSIVDGAGRYDAMRDAVMGLARLGSRGERGVAAALRLIEGEYVGAVAGTRGGESVAAGEFEKARTEAMQIVAADRPMDFYTGDVFNPDGSVREGSWLARWPELYPSGLQKPISAGDLQRYTQSLAGVTPKKVDWLWWPWIPRGKLTMFEGEPDVGKSTMTLTWAALVSKGGGWPRTVVQGKASRNKRGVREPADVVIVGVEDDIADTVVPRLMAAGADLGRVHTFARPRDDDGRPVPFVVPEDVDKLKKAIEEVDAALVIVDPIAAFMSDSVKAGSDSSNRKALMELADVAEQTGASIVLVRHLNKATGMSAKHRGGGSIAFTALARSSLIAAKLPPNDDRANTDATYGLASIKGNLAKAPQALGYRLESSPDDRDSPVVVWAGVLDDTADQLVGADGARPDARKNAPARDEAERLLKQVLAAGPMDANEARRVIKKEVGCSDKTVNSAATKLFVTKRQIRDDRGRVTSWQWELPDLTFPRPK